MHAHAIRTTERLRLRPLDFDDAAFIVRLLNQPSFIANVADKGVRTLDDARGYLERGPLASYARHGFGPWAVDRLDTGEPIGVCGLLRRDFLDDPDLGYAMLEAQWGRGYALEAAAASVAEAREGLGLTRLTAIVKPTTVRSLHLLAKLGFAFERTMTMPGESTSVQVLGLDLRTAPSGDAPCAP